MRLVIQRVKEASVEVGGSVVSAIGPGMLILVGVECGDTIDDLHWLVAKTASLRIFNNEAGMMDLPIAGSGREILAVSQFTLTASTRKGNRPSYIRAARPEEALPLYERFCTELAAASACKVLQGVFGADMQVALVNDGPVTIIIDSKLRE